MKKENVLVAGAIGFIAIAFLICVATGDLKSPDPINSNSTSAETNKANVETKYDTHNDIASKTGVKIEYDGQYSGEDYDGIYNVTIMEDPDKDGEYDVWLSGSSNENPYETLSMYTRGSTYRETGGIRCSGTMELTYQESEYETYSETLYNQTIDFYEKKGVLAMEWYSPEEGDTIYIELRKYRGYWY